MEILNSDLAQSIVERTMEVVSHNINIMNDKGIIIASGDKSRLGTIHEGAIIALQRKSEFNVDENQSKKLNGVYPGINLVIEFQNTVVGVIGVTGRPKEVLGYGKLIKMTAEMMIEQEHFIRELEWNNKIKEEIIAALIYNRQDSFPLLEEYTKKFKIPYNHPMAIFIVELNFEDTSENNDSNLSNRIVSLLEGAFKESLAARINTKTIVLLHKCFCINNKIANYQEKVKEVSGKIRTQIGINAKISTGKVYDKLFDVYKSFEIAKETLAFEKKMYPSDNTYIFDFLKSDMMFSQNNAKWKIHELEDTYQLLS
ncbi:sugar diacid recognition domain-containing protein [Clostridium magnum]|uniref:Carbohydrate diacid regulator n=1 Tax=Clostridium magnum DSM 2767 TaxID=1121326 RepID=A0A161YRN4_9CLOT|nr:sugar diacid recognition domain-containing protein [Clostridium magnum]KZL93642.1 carbohydrate diacid regulator [Clostridium magnum DSM 2767]SHI94311.1 carbohydrate diacid regulator [Clostridium magnum DSM 2767]